MSYQYFLLSPPLAALLRKLISYATVNRTNDKQDLVIILS